MRKYAFILNVCMIQRTRYLDKLISKKENGLVKIITGNRRCGKSYLLFTIYHDYLVKHGVHESQIIELALDEIIWLITLLANQSIKIHNLKNKDDKKEELTTEYVELLTSPLELAEYKSAITEAMFKGTARNIESEIETKNKAGE